MRAKTIADLLSLSVNLYLLSKDEEFLKDLAGLTAKGRQKTEQIYDALTGTGDGEELMEDFLAHVAVIKERIAQKADDMAKVVYEKIHIAHSSEIARLTSEIETLRAALARTEERLNELQQNKA